MRRIIVGMSGGVDSAVAALLLRDAGHDVAALFMKNWDEDDGTEYCTAAVDLIDAEAVCHRLGIALHVANFAREYWDAVFSRFLADCAAGRTPNPDVLCNREIKFRVFADHAATLGADAVATGHYARLPCDEQGVPMLCKGIDAGKDQSYFLHAVPLDQLRRVLFPLGAMAKPEVRERARAAGLHNHARRDSTGICFIGERRMRDFLHRYLPATPGDIETVDGERLGRHAGLIFFTIGQRAGIGVGGRRGGDGTPWYVVDKRMADHTLIVAQGNAHPRLMCSELIAIEPNWLIEQSLPLRCAAKTRYRQPDEPCRVEAVAGDALRVRFDRPQRAVTPGQHVVFYRGDRCLGGGFIESVRSGTS